MTCTLNYHPQVVTNAKLVYMYNHVPSLSTPLCPWYCSVV